MSEEKVSRRSYTKYAAGGIVVVAVAGAGAYYASRPPTTPTSKPTPTATVAPTPTTTAQPTPTPTTRAWEEGELEVQWNAGPQAPWSQSLSEYWNENYRDSTGISTRVSVISFTGYFDKMTAQMASDDPQPDFLIPWSDHVGMYYMYFEDLEPYFEDPELFSSPQGEPYDRDDIWEVARKTDSYEGKQYFWPQWIGQIVSYYRQDIIEEPPKTWDDLLDVARQFTKSVNKNSPTKYGFTFGGSSENTTFKTWLMPYWSFGGQYFKPGTYEPDFNSEAGVKACDYWLTLIKEKLVPSDITAHGFQETWAALASGEVAMGQAWSEGIAIFADPELSPLVAGKMVPMRMPGPKEVVFTNYGAVGIKKASKLKKAAFKYWSWHFYGEGGDMFCKMGSAMPVKHMFTDEFVKDAPNHRAIKEYGYDKAATSDPVYADKGVVNDRASIILTNMLAMKYKTADEAADALQKEIYDYMKEKGYF